MWEPTYLDRVEGGVDPEAAFTAAYESARVLVSYGRDTQDPDVHARLMRLVETEGIEIVANLWAHTSAASLPGALWRLYVVREWIVRSDAEVARLYNRGLEASEVNHAVAGVPPLHGPDEVRATIDQIFGGVFTGDIDVAFDRSAALIRVVLAGADDRTEGIDRDKLETTASDLELAAHRHRAGALLQGEES